MNEMMITDVHSEEANLRKEYVEKEEWNISYIKSKMLRRERNERLGLKLGFVSSRLDTEIYVKEVMVIRVCKYSEIKEY